jgi:SanA protein
MATAAQTIAPMLRFIEKRRRLLLIGGILGVGAATAIIGAARLIERDARPLLHGEITQLPQRRVALVLGCSPGLSSGGPNPFFVRRVEAAARVFHANKAEYILVSGDNHHRFYDEPTAMKNALLRLAVPEERIVLDYAGFSTLDSVVRAQKVFGLSELCIVTQGDHALRALYVARHFGIDAVAYPAADVSYSDGWRTRLRESLARVRTVLDLTVWHRAPRFLGPQIEIGSENASPSAGHTSRGA